MGRLGRRWWTRPAPGQPRRFDAQRHWRVSTMTNVAGFALFGHLLEVCQRPASRRESVDALPICRSRCIRRAGCASSSRNRDWSSFGRKIDLQGFQNGSASCCATRGPAAVCWSCAANRGRTRVWRLPAATAAASAASERARRSRVITAASATVQAAEHGRTVLRHVDVFVITWRLSSLGSWVSELVDLSRIRLVSPRASITSDRNASLAFARCLPPHFHVWTVPLRCACSINASYTSATAIACRDRDQHRPAIPPDNHCRPMLMVSGGDLAGDVQEAVRRRQILFRPPRSASPPSNRVSLHDLELLRRERALLEQDGIRDADLADVMQGRQFEQDSMLSSVR